MTLMILTLNAKNRKKRKEEEAYKIKHIMPVTHLVLEMLMRSYLELTHLVSVLCELFFIEKEGRKEG